MIGFTAWTRLRVLLVLAYRRAKAADDAALVKRIEDAHANCLENLPVFAVIVLAAAALGRPGAVDALAPFVLCVRIGRSAGPLWGTGPLRVLVRAGFWGAQQVVFVWMLLRLVA